MNAEKGRMTRTQVNRRAFLRGVGTVAVGLPFLEGLPDRSAWAQDAGPVFSFFIVGMNGVVHDRFWPTTEAGALTAATLAGKAVEKLAAFSENLLIIEGLKFPISGSACTHAQGCVQALTGIAPGSSGNSATSGGPSVDTVLGAALNPAGTDPLTLYTGQQRGAYIAERISFSAGLSPARAAQQNPYETYKWLVNLPNSPLAVAAPAPSGGTAGSGMSEADVLLLRQKSVNDLVRDEFKSLLGRAELSMEDRRRLDVHLQAIRQLELNMLGTGETINEMNEGSPNTVAGGCVEGKLNKTGLDAFANGLTWNSNGHMIEDIGKLHGETVALAFACNLNRTATLQWGDGTDGTIYKTQTTGAYNTFHKISHRTNSDGSVGNDAWAVDAHAEIDSIRMESLAHIIQAFKDRDLLERSYILWTNSLADGPSHTYNPIPTVIAGSGGGFLKQGQYLKMGSAATTSKLFASLMTAAGVPTEDFGVGGGQLVEAHA
jgi:Protein of unknown function (DUF1552)